MPCLIVKWHESCWAKYIEGLSLQGAFKIWSNYLTQICEIMSKWFRSYTSTDTVIQTWTLKLSLQISSDHCLFSSDRCPSLLHLHFPPRLLYSSLPVPASVPPSVNSTCLLRLEEDCWGSIDFWRCEMTSLVSFYPVYLWFAANNNNKRESVGKWTIVSLIISSNMFRVFFPPHYIFYFLWIFCLWECQRQSIRAHLHSATSHSNKRQNKRSWAAVAFGEGGPRGRRAPCLQMWPAAGAGGSQTATTRKLLEMEKRGDTNWVKMTEKQPTGWLKDPPVLYIRYQTENKLPAYWTFGTCNSSCSHLCFKEGWQIKLHLWFSNDRFMSSVSLADLISQVSSLFYYYLSCGWSECINQTLGWSHSKVMAVSKLACQALLNQLKAFYVLLH